MLKNFFSKKKEEEPEKPQRAKIVIKKRTSAEERVRIAKKEAVEREELISKLPDVELKEQVIEEQVEDVQVENVEPQVEIEIEASQVVEEEPAESRIEETIITEAGPVIEEAPSSLSVESPSAPLTSSSESIPAPSISGEFTEKLAELTIENRQLRLTAMQNERKAEDAEKLSASLAEELKTYKENATTLTVDLQKYATDKAIAEQQLLVKSKQLRI